MTLAHLQDDSKLAGLAPELFLGSMVIFSVAGTVDRSDGRRQVQPVRLNQDLLAKWFTELKLDPEFLPPRIKRVDAWRNATSQASGRTYTALEDGVEHSAELVVEEATSDNEQVTRRIIRRLRVGQRGSERHLATLKFVRASKSARTKASDSVKTTVLSDVRDPDKREVAALIATIDALYEDFASNLLAPAIRGVIRTYLESLNAIPIRGSGGVYFIPRDNWAAVDGLQQLVRRIGQGCVLEQIPLIDAPASREMLTDAFQAEIVEDAFRFERRVIEAQEAATSRKTRVSPRRIAEFDNQYAELVGWTVQYNDVLGLPMGRAADALEIAYEALVELREKSLPVAKKGK